MFALLDSHLFSLIAMLHHGSVLISKNFNPIIRSKINLMRLCSSNGSGNRKGNKDDNGISLQDYNKEQRIERVISNRGGGSRSEVASMIRNGRIKVDGKIIKSSSLKIKNNHKNITIDDKLLPIIPLLAIYNKPIGVHSTIGDPYNRLNLKSLHAFYPYLSNMHPVGRLDADTSGLLLFSKDGQLTQFLLSPLNKVPRVYEAIVIGDINDEKKQLLEKALRDGVRTSDGTYPALLMDAFSLPLVDGDRDNTTTIMAPSIDLFSKINHAIKDKISQANYRNLLNTLMSSNNRNSAVLSNRIFHEAGDGCVEAKGGSHNLKEGRDNDNRIIDDVYDGDGGDDAYNSSLSFSNISCIKLSVTEGKYRMVRRILHNCGYSVIHLHRMQYGSIILDETLIPEGHVGSILSDEELAALIRLFNSNSSPPS